jgi:hypothetical protein
MRIHFSRQAPSDEVLPGCVRLIIVPASFFHGTKKKSEIITFTGNVYMTGKVIENVASNLAVYITDQQNGWGHDVVTGQEAFTAENWGIRNKWLWTPTSSTRILLAGDFAYTRGEVGLGFNQIPQFVAAGGHGY